LVEKVGKSKYWSSSYIKIEF